MKSRITIEVDFNNGNTPVIQILQAVSDDVRDSLIKSFAEMQGGSSWCQLKYVDTNDNFNRIYITPIGENQLKEQAEIILEQDRLNKKNIS